MTLLGCLRKLEGIELTTCECDVALAKTRRCAIQLVRQMRLRLPGAIES